MQEGRYGRPERALRQLAERAAYAARGGARRSHHEIRIPVAVVRGGGDQAEGLDRGSPTPAKPEAAAEGTIPASPLHSLVLTRRQAGPLRPLIFLAHCFGGLVVLRVSHLVGGNGTTLMRSGYRRCGAEPHRMAWDLQVDHRHGLLRDAVPGSRWLEPE